MKKFLDDVPAPPGIVMTVLYFPTKMILAKMIYHLKDQSVDTADDLTRFWRTTSDARDDDALFSRRRLRSTALEIGLGGR